MASTGPQVPSDFAMLGDDVINAIVSRGYEAYAKLLGWKDESGPISPWKNLPPTKRDAWIAAAATIATDYFARRDAMGG